MSSSKEGRIRTFSIRATSTMIHEFTRCGRLLQIKSYVVLLLYFSALLLKYLFVNQLKQLVGGLFTEREPNNNHNYTKTLTLTV